MSSKLTKYYGKFGGQYAPEILKTALDELEDVYNREADSPDFQKELKHYLKEFVGRPSLLYYAAKLSKKWGGRIYLKREDLNFTGAHKINNTIGQILLAKRMGKTRIIAETGAGQHGVATATVAAHFGMACCIYMGAEDRRRQALNVYKMELLGAEVISVTNGQATLKEATSEAMRDWSLNVRNTHYIIGSVVGPYPFPAIVADFQKIIGEETLGQIQEKEKSLPSLVVACVGGGSNAAGIFLPFIEYENVKLLGIEAGGRSMKIGDHAASLTKGRIGVFHSFKSFLLQSKDGQIEAVHSISAGLDYPGVGPLHSYLYDSNRAEYISASDAESVAAFQELCKEEGIIPAMESSHALAGAKRYLQQHKVDKDFITVINLSGRGDKDVAELARYLGKEIEF